MSGTVVAIILIALIIGGALAYIIRAKKAGKKCIGCPESATCSSCKNGACACSKNAKDK